MPLRKINFSLPAINATDSGFSPRAGFPTIKFSIPSQDVLLETLSLRLVGRFQVKSDATTASDSSDNTMSNLGKGPGDADIQPASKVTMAPFGGVKTLIDKVVIQSKKVAKELTSDVNYSQYVALREARFGVDSDFRNSLPSRSMSLGRNAVEAQCRAMISVPSAVESLDKNRGQEFCIRLDIPMLQGKLLHLGDDFLGGLMITLHLAPESAFFATLQDGMVSTPADSIDTYRYTLQDLHLTGRYQVPDASDLKGFDPMIRMDSQLNLVSDIHSSVNSSTLTPQVQAVKGIVNLFLLQSQTNSLTQSQFNYRQVPGLREQVQAKNNVRTPLTFPVRSSPSFQSPSAQAIGDLVYPSLQTRQAENRLQFERALNDGYLPAHTSSGMALTEEATKSVVEASGGGAGATASRNTKVDSIGVGVDYTFGVGLVQSYINQDYALTLDSGIQTGSSKLPSGVRSSPLLQQSFVRNNAFLNTQTLVKQM